LESAESPVGVNTEVEVIVVAEPSWVVATTMTVVDGDVL
jgi:hypothetical protein